MQLRTIVVAAFAAVATAKKDTCAPKNPCKNNAALSAIHSIQATAFCANLLGLETKTVTATATATETAAETLTDVATVVDGQTAVEVATQIVQETLTETVDGETVFVTSTVVRTDVFESLVTETVTSTVVATSTTYPRNGPMKKRDDTPAQPGQTPTELKDFSPAALETACSCLSPSAETVTTTLTATATAHATSLVAQTTTLTSIQTETSTLLQTITSTETQTRPPSTLYTTVYTTSPLTSLTTTTITATTQGGTTTVPGPAFNFVQSYSNNCVPYNYLELYANVQGVPDTFDGIFQWCAQACARDSACTQIWVAVNTPITQSGRWCMTGGGTADKTWDASEIQCNYPPIGRNGYWYGKGS